MKFNDFIKSASGIDPEFVERLTKSGTKIETLSGLQRFARERWPSSYPRDWRAPTPNEPFGREAMSALWGQYLAAREQ